MLFLTATVSGLMRVWRDVLRMQWQRATCTMNDIYEFAALPLPLPLQHILYMYTKGVLLRLKKRACYSGVSVIVHHLEAGADVNDSIGLY